jgi:chromosome segregation ATPase
VDAEFALEPQIRSQVEELKGQFSQTKDLYREVCALLFFRYGVTPTGNKLYQLVRKGSMSAPAEALALFWHDLREKSRVRIEHPDLPEDLKGAAGELIGSLWAKAQTQAQESLSAFRDQAHSSMVEAQSRQAEAEARQRDLTQELFTSQTDLAAAKEQNRLLEPQLSSALASKASLELELQQERMANEQLDRELDRSREALGTTRQTLERASKDLESTKQDLETARREFEATRQRLSATIEGLKASREAAETRHREETADLSAKLDQARAKSDQLQNNMEALRDAAASANELHRIEEAKLQGENGNLRQQIGVLEGKLQGILAHREELSKEVKTLHNHQNELNVEAGVARAEAEIWKEKARILEGQLAELSRPAGASSDHQS